MLEPKRITLEAVVHRSGGEAEDLGIISYWDRDEEGHEDKGQVTPDLKLWQECE